MPIRSTKESTLETAPLVTAAELAEHLAMSTGSVYKMASARKIRSYAGGPRLGGVRFNLQEVLEDLRRPALKQETRSVV